MYANVHHNEDKMKPGIVDPVSPSTPNLEKKRNATHPIPLSH